MSLHENNIGKTRKILAYTLSILPSLLIVFSGVNKVIGSQMMVESMSTIHLLNIMPFIGILEIACVVLYWIPKTSNIGFFLLCSYVGGIIAAETIMTEGTVLPILGIIVAVLLYVGTMLRKPSLSGLGI